MPELPEAETIARGLNQVLPGKAVRRMEVVREDVLAAPAARFAVALRGNRIRCAGRRGKNVVLEFDDRVRVVVNLGMTGRLLPLPAPGANGPGADGIGPGRPGSRPSSAPTVGHPAVVFHLDDGGRLVYDDARRFGRLSLLLAGEWMRWSRGLGPEPLSSRFSAKVLRSILVGRAAPVRSVLLDQKRIAGVGNIYAVEALWSARVHPRLPSGAVGADAVRRLHRSLRRVLRDAIRARGTTLRDYRTSEGTLGGFGPALRAYGREGEPCSRCGASIRRIVFSGRSAFYCPGCQGSGTDPRRVHPDAKPA